MKINKTFIKNELNKNINVLIIISYCYIFIDEIIKYIIKLINKKNEIIKIYNIYYIKDLYFFLRQTFLSNIKIIIIIKNIILYNLKNFILFIKKNINLLNKNILIILCIQTLKFIKKKDIIYKKIKNCSYYICYTVFIDKVIIDIKNDINKLGYKIYNDDIINIILKYSNNNLNIVYNFIKKLSFNINLYKKNKIDIYLINSIFDIDSYNIKYILHNCIIYNDVNTIYNIFFVLFKKNRNITILSIKILYKLFTSFLFNINIKNINNEKYYKYTINDIFKIIKYLSYLEYNIKKYYKCDICILNKLFLKIIK